MNMTIVIKNLVLLEILTIALKESIGQAEDFQVLILTF